VSVSLDPGSRKDGAEAFHRQALALLGTLPGVEGATLAHPALLDGDTSMSVYRIAGSGTEETLPFLVVDASFFATLGIPMRQGRAFAPGDDRTAPLVAIVNEAFARKFAPGRSPLDLTFSRRGRIWRIVGVCPDLRTLDLRSGIQPTLFFTDRQASVGAAGYLLRTRTPLPALAPMIRKAVAAVDPGVPVARIETQASKVLAGTRQERLLASLATFMAAFALLLSCLGTYGLVTSDTRRRMGEFGIRAAMGAPPAALRHLVLREALALGALGAALGLAGARALTGILKAFLYGVTATDPATFAGVAVLLLLVALLATLLPAWRASRASPAETLRAQ
jgi:hypothetical protein